MEFIHYVEKFFVSNASYIAILIGILGVLYSLSTKKKDDDS